LKCGGEFGIGDISKDEGNVAFNWMIRKDSEKFRRARRSELG
jgi:hypothetical protein